MHRYQDRHLRIMTEVRALTYEADELRRRGGEHALGMFAAAHALREHCHSEVPPEERFTQEVDTRLGELRKYITDMTDLRHTLALEHSKRTRLYTLPHPELIALADVAASNAYLTHARTSGWGQGSARQEPGSCSPMFYLMQQELRKTGVESQHMWWSEACNNHHFLGTTMPNGDTIFMDPTWQQYLPKGTDYSQHPNVLIMPDDRMEEILSYHGVPESCHRTWQAAKVDPRAESDPSRWDTGLRRAFENDPWIPSLPLDKQRFYSTS